MGQDSWNKKPVNKQAKELKKNPKNKNNKQTKNTTKKSFYKVFVVCMTIDSFGKAALRALQMSISF